MINLHNYNTIIINSSAGKDSLAAIFRVCELAKKQNFPLSKIVISHQCLGESEWTGTKELAKQQADLFGLQIYYSSRKNKDGKSETLLEYVERRGKWPSNKQRYCTSDFKRGPGGKVVTAVSPSSVKEKVLYVFGFRKVESPARAKRKSFSKNSNLTNKSRKVYDWLPIHGWSDKMVWQTIKENNLPYHPAYDLGMPRLSCVFCVFSPFDALVIAGKHNPVLLNKYVETEKKIGHSFRSNMSIESVQKAITSGYTPSKISNWIM